MKLQGFSGTGSGKLGSSVFSVAAGQQIVRQYQPNVSNPSTLAQINQRAKMKLLAQLAAAISSVIAIPKKGLVSARNQFISKNFAATSAVSGTADINLPELQLTEGSVTLPNVIATRQDGNAIAVNLEANASLIASRIIYVAFERANDGSLILLDSNIVENAGENGTFPSTLAYSEKDVVVYAYGMIDANANATAKYGNYGVVSGEDVARLVATSTISTSEYNFTRTSGVMIARETSADFTSVTVGGVTIAAGSQVNIPYASSLQVNVNAIDVDDLYLYIDAGLDSPVVRPFNNGNVNTTINNLGGGETIIIAIGDYDGVTFTNLKQFTGRPVVAAQNTTITALTMNGVAVGNSGNTQIGVAGTIALHATAEGITNLVMRYKVNGTPSTFIPNIDGAFDEDITGLSIGDVVTFEIGHNINNTFVPSVVYGGSAVIAENPPTFNSVVINGNTIAASGTTQLVAGESATIVVNASNADGKKLFVKSNGGNWEDAGVTIASGTGTTQFTPEVGQTLQFALGVVSGSSYDAQAVFGGAVEWVEQPAGPIAAVSINGEALTENKTYHVGGLSVNSLVVTPNGSQLNGKQVAVVYKSSMPVADDNLRAYMSGTITNGQPLDLGAKELVGQNSPGYYVVSGIVDSGYIIVEEVFPYYFHTWNGE